MSDGGNRLLSHKKGRVPMDASARVRDPEFNDSGLPPTFAEIAAMPSWVRSWVVRRLAEQVVTKGASVREFYLRAPAWARVILDQVFIKEAAEV